MVSNGSSESVALGGGHTLSMRGGRTRYLAPRGADREISAANPFSDGVGRGQWMIFGEH